MMVETRWTRGLAVAESDHVQPFFAGRALRTICVVAVLLTGVVLTGCGAINPGKFRGIERTSSDENYYLVKDAFLTAGSAAHPRKDFEHTMQESINLIFLPANEKNYYISKTRWVDPSGEEFRVMRQTHDKTKDEKRGDSRPKGGTRRIYSVSTKELYDHKPGLWKVELYLDDVLVRRLPFNVY